MQYSLACTRGTLRLRTMCFGMACALQRCVQELAERPTYAANNAINNRVHLALVVAHFPCNGEAFGTTVSP